MGYITEELIIITEWVNQGGRMESKRYCYEREKFYGAVCQARKGLCMVLPKT